MKKTLIAMAIFFAAGIIIGTQLRSCRGKVSQDTRTLHSDTVVRYIGRTDTLLRLVATYRPVAVRKLSGSQDITNRAMGPSLTNIPDTVIYADSLYHAHEFKAVIADTVLGRILGRSVQWADLTQLKVQTITNNITIEKKPPLVKVYLGADAGLRYAMPLERGGIDIAPAVSIVFSDRYMVDAAYYVLSGEISAGVKIKLSVR